jgi:hypothetical protein
MDKKFLVFILLLMSGFSCLGNAVHYFLSGEQYSNTDLRNYAVAVQIAFALAVILYGFWHYKTSSEKVDK